MTTQIMVNNSNSDSDTHTNTIIELQLGDIIRIEDPTNEILNNNVFLIDYIDRTKIQLISEKELKKSTIKN